MTRATRTFSVFLLFAATALAQRNPKPGFNMFSREQDVQLGREAAAQIERQVQIVNNPELENYIRRVGQRLGQTPEAGNFPYTFKVVNDPSINAFALPGGPTYVHTGLIRAADNEAQLVGVMAHEIAHVALRHGTNQASKANLLQLPAAIAGAAVGGGGGSLLGQLAQLGIGLGFNSVLLKFSRGAERDADILGAQMMSRSGWNPLEMARFFEKLEAQGGHRGPEFLASHPNPGNRMKTIQEEIRYLPQRNYSAESTGDFARIKALVGGMPAPSRRRQRSALDEGELPQGGDVRPSGSMREYRGSAFSVAYPSNWEAFGDSQGSTLTIAPRAGILQQNGGATQIAYGVILSYYVSNGRSVNLRQDTDDLIRELQRTNPGLEVGNRRQQRLTVGGSTALATTLYSESPYRGETEHDTLVTVARPEGLFYMLFITPARDAGNMQQTFEQMLRSVRFNNS